MKEEKKKKKVIDTYLVYSNTLKSVTAKQTQAEYNLI